MFSARLPSPSALPEFDGENGKVFEVQGYREIYVQREPVEIDETVKRSSPDDRDFGVEVFGNRLQLRKVLELLLSKHGSGQELPPKFSRGLVRARIFAAQEFGVDEPRRREHLILALLPEHHVAECFQYCYRTVAIR
jgi:hypothetical protein